jgi:hypothetical protein
MERTTANRNLLAAGVLPKIRHGLSGTLCRKILQIHGAVL